MFGVGWLDAHFHCEAVRAHPQSQVWMALNTALRVCGHIPEAFLVSRMVWQAWANPTGVKNNRFCFEEGREGEAGIRASISNAIQSFSFLDPRLAQLPR